MITTCPSCETELNSELNKCPVCGYGFNLLSAYYAHKSPPKITKRITDRTKQTLKGNDYTQILEHADRFTESFPDLFFATYIESRQEVADTKGLWLHNFLTFSDLAPTVAPQGGILLYLDPDQGSIALSRGLLLLPYLTDAECESFLRDAISLFEARQYPEAYGLIIDTLTHHLISKCPTKAI